jgi:hypothetical protein
LAPTASRCGAAKTNALALGRKKEAGRGRGGDSVSAKRFLRYNRNSAFRFILPNKSAPLAQLDRASGYEPEGREFESLRAHHLSFLFLLTAITI